MKFWDSSAVVPLLVEEAETAFVLDLYRRDPELVAWWGAAVECASALGRLERGGKLDLAAASVSLARLNALREAWHEVQPGERVRELAMRLLRVHELRAADALQLGAALQACDNRPGALDFVCFDTRLVAAARREGFNVIEA
ncbi:MAG: type II toxin-antitoxin system VapC family toxin [Burkholderiales bacterium]